MLLQPRWRLDVTGLGSSHFDRHYSGNRCFFLFLQVLRCFSSLRLLSLRCMRPSTAWVAPFGHLRINSCLRIPGAFRSLPRPSSLSEAKASSVRSSSLSRTYVNHAMKISLHDLSRFASEIVVPNIQTKKLILILQTLISLLLFYLVISLSIVNELIRFPLRFRKGRQRYALFLNYQTFFKKICIFLQYPSFLSRHLLLQYV